MDEKAPATKSPYTIREVINLAANVVTILVVLVPLLVSLVRNPVTVEVEVGPSGLPPFLSSKLVEISKASDADKRSSEGIGTPLRELSQRLLRVRRVARVTLTNGSRSTVKEVSVKVPNVWNAEFYSLACTSCTHAESDAILSVCKYDEFSSQVIIGPIPHLSPQSTVTISIYGDFAASMGPAAVASYAQGEARLIKSEKVEGLQAVFAKLGPFGVVILALLFIGQQILRRVK